MNRLLPYLKYWPVLAIVLALSALAYGSHESRMRGIAEERAHEAQQQANAHARAATALLKVVKQQDSLIKEKAKSFTNAKIVYRNRVDSIHILPAPDSAPKGYALVDTASMHSALHAADSAIASADSVISEQAHQIVTLKAVESERESQIGFLNRQIDAQVQELKHVKRQGWTRTILAAGFGVVLGVASR